MKVGVLALQGAVEPHMEKLRELGVEGVRVRKPEHLLGLDGIILPGGESTTMIHTLKLNKLWNELKAFSEVRPTWGICAGAILLSKDVSHPKQDSLGLLDVAIERNAYGRQTESFIAELKPANAWTEQNDLEAVFIRAPKINNLGPVVTTLMEYESSPVMVEQGHLLVTTFHPELSKQNTIHKYFLEKVIAFATSSESHPTKTQLDTTLRRQPSQTAHL